MQSNTEAAYKGMSSASSSNGGHGSSSGPSVLTVAGLPLPIVLDTDIPLFPQDSLPSSVYLYLPCEFSVQ